MTRIVFAVMSSLILVGGCDLVNLGSGDPDLDGFFVLLTIDDQEINPYADGGPSQRSYVSVFGFNPEPYYSTSISVQEMPEDAIDRSLDAVGEYTFDPGSQTVMLSWPDPPPGTGNPDLSDLEEVRSVLAPDARLDGDWLFVDVGVVEDMESALYPLRNAQLRYLNLTALCRDRPDLSAEDPNC